MIPQPLPTGDAAREVGLSPPQPAGKRWRHFFSLARTYWGSGEWKSAWAMLIVLVVLQFGTASTFIMYNRWQQTFFDSISNRQVGRLGTLLLWLLGILALQVAVSLLDKFLSMQVAIRWRTALTQRYLAGWLHHDRFAEIERLRLIDNPDQRIADDINLITGGTGSTGVLSIALGAISAAVSAVSFGYILLQTAEPFRFRLFGHALTIPGSTIWYVIAYVAVGSLLTAAVGRALIRATMRQQHREADFRANLIHVRRNAMQISFIGAVVTEMTTLRQAFDQIRWNFRSVIRASLSLAFVQFVYERFRAIVPYIILVPRYFAGSISFGQVMSGSDAFQHLASSLSYFVQVYPAIGVQVASVNRLKALDDAIHAKRARGIALNPIGAGSRAVIETRALALHRPHGEGLLHVDDWSVRPGERWLIQGASGGGKSTLLRAVAGLWPDGSGGVAMARDGLVMLVPQRLYMPLGTLKAAICFPDRTEDHDDEGVQALLRQVNLDAHVGNLHLLREWTDELSPGEQQRVALARILLHRPTLLVLDEATSALDPPNARMFYEVLLDTLPAVTLVSVVHDDRLAVYHTHALTIAEGTATPRSLTAPV